jgi:mono/diheme cytochrome c family protein
VNLRASVLKETPAELYDLIARPTGRTIDAADNTHPAFADVLSSAQIWNLVKFMREEWFEPTDLYTLKVEGPVMHWDYSTDPPTLATPTRTYSDIGIGGNASSGEVIYLSRCAECHNETGTALGMSVGNLVRTKPHEIWLKAKFGEPGHMPAGLVTDLQEMKDLFKALINVDKFPD